MTNQEIKEQILASLSFLSPQDIEYLRQKEMLLGIYCLPSKRVLEIGFDRWQIHLK